MIYITIDTNILKSLVSKNRIHPHLSQLYDWFKNEKLKIIVSDALFEEWEKHKEYEINNIDKAIKKRADDLNFFEVNVHISETQVSEKKNILLEQIDFLDQIFNNYAIKVELTENVKTKTFDSQRNGLAPFHNKFNSINDAIIYFSAIEYIKQQNLEKIIFISNNSEEFSLPTDKNKLHPDLYENGVQVDYYLEINKLIEALNTKYNLPLSKQSLLNKDYSFSKDNYKSNSLNNILNREKNILYVFDTIFKHFNGLSYIPKYIIVQLNPFHINKEKSSTFYEHTLFTSNEELFELFENITNNKIDKYEFNRNNQSKKKIIKGILSFFKVNLIFYIELNKSNKRINIAKLFTYGRCNCERCSFYRLEFDKSITQLKSKNIYNGNEIRNAYTHYLWGNYEKAQNLFIQQQKIFWKRKEYIKYFITCFNIQKLSSKTFNKTKIDLNDELEKIRKHTNYEVYETCKWYSNIKNIYTNTWDILDVNYKTTTKYISDKKGGWSKGYNFQKIYLSFYEVAYSTGYNNLVFNHFLEYKHLLFLTFESLIKSNNIVNPNSDKIENLDTFFISQLIIYGDEHNLNNVFKRTDIKSFSYPKLQKDFFLNLLENIESSFPILFHYMENNSNVKNKIEEIIINLLFLISKTVIAERLFNKIFRITILLCIKYNFKSYSLNEQFINLIKPNGKVISKANINLILDYYFEHNFYSGDTLLSNITSIINKKFDDFKLSKKINKLILTEILRIEENKSIKQDSAIFELSNILPLKYKKRFSDAIDLVLLHHFNNYIFYTFTIRGIIPLNMKNLIKMKESISNSWNENKYMQQKNYKTNTTLNMYINLVFKFNLTLNENDKKELHNNIPYYNWLLNLETFDYAKFNPFWILEYQTKYYFKAFSRVPQIKIAIKNYLEYNYIKKLSEVYIQFFD